MDDLKAVSKAINYLREYQLFTLEDLDTALQGVSEKARTEALSVRANQVLPRTKQTATGAESSAAQKTEYATLTGTCRFLL